MQLMSLFLNHFSQVALAENQPGLGQTMGPIIPLLLMFAVFYFLVIRPQQKKAKVHQRFLSELKRGDMVVTNAGIIGTIRNISDKFVTLEVDDDVCIKMLRGQISESANTLKEEAKKSEEKR